MKLLLQMLALLLATLISALVYAYVQSFVQTTFFGMAGRTYVDMVSCALAGSIGAAAVISLPIAAIFRKKYSFAAAFISSPIIALRLNDFFSYRGSLAQEVQVMSVVEGFGYLAALLVGTHVASRFWRRPNNSFKPTPLRGVGKAS